ncbi:GtrA family protein [Cellulomonas alba]|uniref:GtrA family protein n=1 Tax=Cellulomonas alba TaxID=3053467 RepID=A0ABT7SCZ0_9CELL|nr:GtrA family protein [Cellulomonas alba]MDM7854050.1 GtrA family protein [Cellulomonas alba]
MDPADESAHVAVAPEENLVLAAEALAAPPTPVAIAPTLRERAAELIRFLSVGGVSFVVDLGLFNLLLYGPGHVLEHKPLTAKVISLVAATLVSWVGNRHWTFSQHRTARRGHELLVFSAINVVGALVPVATLALSRYALGLHSQLADNVSTVLGIGLATVIRYVGYKKWVFTGR